MVIWRETSQLNGYLNWAELIFINRVFFITASLSLARKISERISKKKHGRSKVKILVLTVATKNLCAFIPIIENNVIIFKYIIVQKMKFSIKDFYSKYDRIRRKLRIWSHLLQKSLMENIFCAVYFEVETMLQNLLVLLERTRGTPVKRLKAIVT